MSLPAALPEGFDPSVPLSDPRYERFAQLRAIGVPNRAAANEAGFLTRGGKELSPGNAARLDRHLEVVARKRYLAADDAEVIAATRLFVRSRLMNWASLNLLGRYGILGEVEVGGQKITRIVGIDWQALKESEHSSAVTNFKFDRETGVLVEIGIVKPEEAIAQLRDMDGLRAARRKELSGPGGAPIQTEDVTRYTDDELAELERIQIAAQTRRSVTHPDPG